MIEPYYHDDWITLYHGDMRDLGPELSHGAALIVADPPYQATAIKWDTWPRDWPRYINATSMWCFGSLRMFLDHAGEFGGWALSHDLVWSKPVSTGGARIDRFRRSHEQIAHWYRGPWADVYRDPQKTTGPVANRNAVHRGANPSQWHGTNYGPHTYVDDGTRYMTTVIDSVSMWKRNPRSPTEKPLRLLDPLIRWGCPPSGLVLDPFAGSGSTGEAARQAGRRSLLIEADERQCEGIAARMAQGFIEIEEATP